MSEPSNRADEAQAILEIRDKDGKPKYSQVVGQDPTTGNLRARRHADHTKIDTVNLTESAGG